MITLEYQAIQYYNLDIEGLTEDDVREMDDEEVTRLIEREQ